MGNICLQPRVSTLLKPVDEKGKNKDNKRVEHPPPQVVVTPARSTTPPPKQEPIKHEPIKPDPIKPAEPQHPIPKIDGPITTHRPSLPIFTPVVPPAEPEPQQKEPIASPQIQVTIPEDVPIPSPVPAPTPFSSPDPVPSPSRPVGEDLTISIPAEVCFHLIL